jgi:hemin uptake protein HemP
MSTERPSSDPSPQATPPASSCNVPLPQGPASHADTPQVWYSEQLLGSHVEALIVHNQEVYRLRRTRQGKLILYK